VSHGNGRSNDDSETRPDGIESVRVLKRRVDSLDRENWNQRLRTERELGKLESKDDHVIQQLRTGFEHLVAVSRDEAKATREQTAEMKSAHLRQHKDARFSNVTLVVIAVGVFAVAFVIAAAHTQLF
jgi:hypothetical protein